MFAIGPIVTRGAVTPPPIDKVQTGSSVLTDDGPGAGVREVGVLALVHLHLAVRSIPPVGAVTNVISNSVIASGVVAAWI